MASDLTPEQFTLYTLMSDVSEDCYAAGWMSGTEDAVWFAATGAPSWAVGHESLPQILAIAEHIGFWIEWDRDAHSPRAVPLDEWRARRDPRTPEEIAAAGDSATPGGTDG